MDENESTEAEAPRTGLLIETTWDKVPVGAIVTVPRIGDDVDSNAHDHSSDAGMAYYVTKDFTGKHCVPLRDYQAGDRPDGRSSMKQLFSSDQRLVVREVVSIAEIEQRRQASLDYRDPYGSNTPPEKINQHFDKWRAEIDAVLNTEGATAQ